MECVGSLEGVKNMHDIMFKDQKYVYLFKDEASYSWACHA